MSDTHLFHTLETGHIGKLLLQYSIPAIIGTAATSLYNVIDRIFIGQGVGPLAISGLALTFPLMNLAAAFGSLVGSGAATMVSIRLGEQDKHGATHILGNAFFLNVVIGLLYSALFLIFLNPILYLFGASNDTLPYARDFMQIILSGNVVTHLYIGLNNIMRASGYPRKAMVATLLTVGVNLLFAPLFIFSFHWGIRGAALATIIAQVVGAIWVFLHFTRRRHHLSFVAATIIPQWSIVRKIFTMGMPTFLMFLAATVVTILINVRLKKYGGDFAIGAYGIIGSFGMLFPMIVLGINQGMQPIAGYNLGARKYDRVMNVFSYAVKAGIGVGVAGFLLCEFFPEAIASAFTNNPELLGLATNGMRIVMAMFPVIGFQMVATGFFQSIGYAKTSIILSLSRQVLLLIPALLVLPHFFGLTGVWVSIPAADFFSALLTFFILRIQLKNIGTEH